MAVTYKQKKGHALVLRTCDEQMRSHGGFQWPESGPVEASDWQPTAECGNGLHGLLWGVGDATLLDLSESARWLVVDVVEADCIDLSGKVKFPRGEVVFCGSRDGALDFLEKHGGDKHPGIFVTRTAGHRGTATAGYGGTATAGHRGTATAGDRGTATAGYGGTATAGDRGTATAGDRGTATAGDRGTATAGYGGALAIQWYDDKKGRYRWALAEVGENDIEANVAYRVQNGKFVRAEAQQ